MNLLIISDIFGRTQALDDFAKYFAVKKIKTEILDPYNQQYLNFDNENEAYNSFQEEIGLKNYINLLKNTLTSRKPTETVLLGFSVGASAIWAVSHDLQGELFKGVCFYSSQIRHYMEIEPKIDIELYFAQSEPTYEIGAVASKLAIKKRVTCFQTNFMHGFMNERSTNFNKEGFIKYRKIINIFMDNSLTDQTVY